MSKEFIWGAATASYQIEGHFGEFETIWDTFSLDENNVYKNHNGEVACNHYHMFEEDIELLKGLGVDYYRLSISWARIMPKKGEISEKGLAFYHSLLSSLKKAGIKSNVTMYHWDMPSWIYEENKGWISRETTDYFMEYAKSILERLDDLVDVWTTFNEPYCSAFLGYYTGDHAPGHNSVYEYAKATHNLLLTHGLVMKYYREHYSKPIGIVLNLSHVKTNNPTPNNLKAVSMQDATLNRMYLDPIFKGHYPSEILEYFELVGINVDYIEVGDMALIAQELDIFGINYYTHSIVKYNDKNDFYVEFDGTNLPKTDMGWDISPDALGELIIRLRNDYTDVPLYVTENGAAFDDVLVNGEVHDVDRVEYLKSHTDIILSMKEEYDIKGYYVWSLLDNFEWAFGYSKRFGIVYVDFETGKRYPKDSYHYVKELIKNNQ